MRWTVRRELAYSVILFAQRTPFQCHSSNILRSCKLDGNVDAGELGKMWTELPSVLEPSALTKAPGARPRGTEVPYRSSVNDGPPRRS
ncbi:hypothetical protein PsYK624_078840 [Phanerochaete sordida]|uniref:Uncharacterized protein n=1 Tax=Phanerochaete sordida TaxID=48140 RepID=A0A9P3GBA5_9APHY|nr:hypothetical protein PsYK624_078840 [Phanerochaete sordida]